MEANLKRVGGGTVSRAELRFLKPTPPYFSITKDFINNGTNR